MGLLHFILQYLALTDIQIVGQRSPDAKGRKMDTQKFIQQAGDYEGTPNRIAKHVDGCGETHVIIEMILKGGGKHYLDWIGGEYAPEPDECGDEVPFSGLRWGKVVVGSPK